MEKIKTKDSIIYTEDKYGVVVGILHDDYKDLKGSKESPIYIVSKLEKHADGSFTPTLEEEYISSEGVKRADIIVSKSLAFSYSMYTKGLESMPVKYIDIKMTVDKEGEEPVIKAILTKEIEDRDGEIVMVNGIEIGDTEKGVPLLDCHAMWGSIVDNVLGRVINIKKKKVDGVAIVEGELKFADTPRGVLAKMLVVGGFVDSVSIGFGVREYNPDEKRILKSELYETSLVSVPANQGALIEVSKGIKEAKQEVSDVEKKLKRYEQIAPVFKTFTKYFFSDEFTKRIGLEKTENIVMDTIKMYDILNSLITKEQEEDSKVQTNTNSEEAPQGTVHTASREEIDNIVQTSFDNFLSARDD